MQKRCTKCGEEKPLDLFGKDKRAADGRRSDCKACHSHVARAWNSANKERHHENTKKSIAKNREVHRDRCRAWAAQNTDKMNSYFAARRARIKSACPPWADRKAIEAFYAEAVRLTEETGIPHEVDHIIPLAGRSVSGLHVSWNLQVIPASENRKKSNSYLER